MLKAAFVLPFTAALLGAAPAAPPVYFVASDLPASCAVLGQHPSAQIFGNRLDLGAGGQYVAFLNARAGVPCALEQSEKRLSVFTGNNPSRWQVHMPISRRIRFHSVYDGIDLVYHGNGSRLEYDFEIAPGAAGSQIRLGFAPGSDLKISERGDLVVSRGGQTFLQRRPEASQGNRIIAARYVIDRARRQVRIALGRYDRSRPLTIDPVLVWQTRTSSGSNLETIATDAGGNLWILSDSPDHSLSFTKTFGPGGSIRDIFIMKIDPTGANVLYAVVIGGSNVDIANAVAIDADGNAFITGATWSNDFPITGQAFQQTQPSVSGGSAFVVKLSPQGDSLVYSTYLGGSGNAIAVDNADNAIVTGTVAPTFL
jgi:hypothetical protein